MISANGIGFRVDESLLSCEDDYDHDEDIVLKMKKRE